MARSDATDPLLTLSDITAGYDKKKVLDGISLKVAAGEAVALIGHNGAGKTTILRSIFGLQPPWSGQVAVEGAVLNRRHTCAIAVALGMSMIPAERFVFPDLTVSVNLQISARKVPPPERARRIEAAYADFPILLERRAQMAGTMSGGQQRMVSLAMALMTRPRLLLLDEPSLGLSPTITEQIMVRVRRLVNEGMSVVLVEQNIPAALMVADRVYVLRSGRILLEESADALRARGRENWWTLF